MVPPLLQQPLFQCHFLCPEPFFCNLLLRVFPSLFLLPPGLLIPLLLLLCLLPLSGLPLHPSPLDICRSVPQFKFRKSVSGNFYLPHSTAFLRTHCQIINSVFVKSKILKYKVSQLQLKSALDNCKKETPILQTLPDVIHQMLDSK